MFISVRDTGFRRAAVGETGAYHQTVALAPPPGLRVQAAPAARDDGAQRRGSSGGSDMV